jgi:hypothetical protein
MVSLAPGLFATMESTCRNDRQATSEKGLLSAALCAGESQTVCMSSVFQSNLSYSGVSIALLAETKIYEDSRRGTRNVHIMIEGAPGLFPGTFRVEGDSTTHV